MVLQDLVTSQAERRPNATAVTSGPHSITYGELSELSDRLAHHLILAGCGKGDRVVLLLPKSIEAVVGMLGILKSGGIYVPVDTVSPVARIEKIMSACEPKAVLAAGAGGVIVDALVASDILPYPVQIGWMEPRIPETARFTPAFRWSDLKTAPCGPVPQTVALEDPAHILFTSGSTGTPKGVAITHGNVMNFIGWATSYFGTSPEDRISGHPPFHFDLSTFDIYGTFLAGAELHLVPPETSLLPHRLAEFIRESRLTQWFSVPSVFRYMAQFDVVKQEDFRTLRRVLWCGEALPTPTLIYWMRRLPHATFTNLYGPTETTIASSYYTVPRCPETETDEIPIGTACEGEELLVLDETLEPVGAGQIGELYIAGKGLSPGYWRDPDKTTSAFVSRHGGIRMYRTGDLAKTDHNGLIYLIGRADSQIKSRGYRIELGEVEAALYALGLLRECAVVGVPSDGFEGTAICCAYVPGECNVLSAADLRQSLATLLPSYMLPSRWMAFDALPLNVNGKVDRPALKQQFLTR